MELSDRDKEIVKGYIDRGKPLPPKYKLMLFADAPEVELVWQGKTSEVTNVVLPFQSIEHIDEPRAEIPTDKGSTKAQEALFASDARGRQASGWTNKLIWGDNKLVLSSLKNGPLRREIEAAGGLKLIYIDPPFDVGADFSVSIEIDDDAVTKAPTVIEELAYRDTWGVSGERYLAYMYERLSLMSSLLADDGTIVVHCDWHVNHRIRVLLDELFGSSKLLNEIIWLYKRWSTRVSVLPRLHDNLYWYAKSETYAFNQPMVPNTEPNPSQYVSAKDASGKTVVKRDSQGKPVKREIRVEIPAPDYWDIPLLSPVSEERLGYATQKPERLLAQLLRMSTREGDLMADFFCGSGTTLAVAEKLGRKWIGCDLGRYAIHVSRKRLIGVQRQLKAEGKPYRSFEILNLGKYERQYFVGIDPNLPEKQRRELSLQKEEHYLTLILTAYKAERVFQTPPFHGRKAGTMVVVGPIDSPVTLDHVNEVLAACRKHKIPRVDILGFEFEMSLTPRIQDDARLKGVSLSLKYIPKDVFDKRAVDRGQVVFYDVGYVEVQPKVKGRKVSVALKEFGVFYRQDDLDTVGQKLKPGGTKVTVENGQVVKVTKDKKGVVKREVLTKKWTDWIDYWAVDFNYENRKEILRVVEDGEEREVWTGNYIFENEWQSYRTRKDRTLEMTSVSHEYDRAGKYKVAVKVIDIFGNDTTKVVEVKV